MLFIGFNMFSSNLMQISSILLTRSTSCSNKISDRLYDNSFLAVQSLTLSSLGVETANWD
ncbi:hypothetical protein HanXRQr2_Chr11g0501211 [Helianthus annuus]|uniref:Uncharacterized protein n=1 Tax=Helianthus annuus TaxID=4232 RepID=A0A9K3HRA0_HELAN|nr:hypothetical protein HanXRQr2_Chr11g0501211 [Helianthus annuus]KAJ0875970.1 hypothetical protein HanPSC8_Chr11g0483001 [Helianthus annuus]